MADLVLGNVERIFKVAAAIKDAVDTEKENNEDCVRMAKTADNVSAQIRLLKENSTSLEDPSTSSIIKSVKETLERALKLVNEYQGKNVFSRFFNAKGTSKKLDRIQKQISTDLATLGLRNEVKIIRILEHQQYAGQVEASQSTHSRTDEARSVPVNSEKGKTVVARKRSEQSELLSGVHQFNLSQFKDASNDFSKDSVVERRYYKGVLSDGIDVSIKKVSISEDREERNLQQQLSIRAKLQHGNIVKLLGYCQDSQEGKKLYFLVEEYIPNVKSLKSIMNVSRLDWPSCFKIIHGIAKALYCLHKDLVLYMDLNPADIFVRSDMNPVIIDFESSIVLDRADDKITGEALLTGTSGYVAPEKLIDGSASLKSDVFSFGIILIEIITGRKLQILDDLPEWGSLDDITRSKNGLFDPAQAKESQLVKINRCREVGLKCIEPDPKHRPPMAHVLEMLNS